MKAVNKFKKIVAEKRPPIMSSILGDGDSPRFSQPPLTMQRDAKARPLNHKSQSLDTFDRRGIDGALAVEGVHHDMDVAQSPADMSPEVIRSSLVTYPVSMRRAAQDAGWTAIFSNSAGLIRG